VSDFGEGPKQGWYDTGDIVSVDYEGFLTIQGRVKRFAKIGGEMISLVNVEEKLNKLWPDGQHIILNYPDSKKGEQLIALTTLHLTRGEIQEKLKEMGLSDLSIPRKIFHVDKIPLLATGKPDLPQAKEIGQKFLIDTMG
jgi:acyl-[acyl-carrier-protein]-phospholipid O-acyltransferase/long-chain-fatty-acid--[acyl-carrier-protein] ligase